MTLQVSDGLMTRPERRKFQRRKFQGEIEIEWGSAVLNGIIRDIGPQGLFVELTPQLWLGATFKARLLLNPVLWLDCRVVRVEPRGGNATVFEIPTENGKEQLDALLKILPLL